MGEVGPELGVCGVQDAGDETELGDGGVEVGEHEVPDAEEGEAGDGGTAQPGWEDEEEDLGDVVVALEVVYVRVAAQDGQDEVGEAVFVEGALLIAGVLRVVDERTLDV